LPSGQPGDRTCLCIPNNCFTTWHGLGLAFRETDLIIMNTAAIHSLGFIMAC